MKIQDPERSGAVPTATRAVIVEAEKRGVSLRLARVADTPYVLSLETRRTTKSSGYGLAVSMERLRTASRVNSTLARNTGFSVAHSVR